jgi:hypothetical protein
MRNFVLLCIFLFAPSIFAINELVVKVPNVYNSLPGYIDRATLVVQPFGGYIEQSLYLEYSDHNQFHGYSQAEVIHRFELPQGSTVNDLWLWIGDSVMKAIVLDTWTARHIYDTIVVMKRDPAFLVKKGNQYELHIFPLTPGSMRKIKLNFITPVRASQDNVLAALPLDMLKCSHNSVQPLKILFRTDFYSNYSPHIKEIPSANFNDLLDTLDYHYKIYTVQNIQNLSTFNLTYDISGMQSTYFRSNENDNQQRYFQLMFNPKDIFNLSVDSSSKRVMFALDFSSDLNKDRASLQDKLSQFFHSALKSNDYFNIILAGAGRVRQMFPGWQPGDTANITETLNSLFRNAFFDSTLLLTRNSILFAENEALDNWGFTGLNNMAQIKQCYSLVDAIPFISSYPIFASYRHGFNGSLISSDSLRAVQSLDTLFSNGGRFLTYYDFNRDHNGENIARHFINGLHTLRQIHENITLYREPAGNIGLDFPESVEHAGTYFLAYNDPQVKIELKNANGEPAVISKKIGNGIIVVSGLWEFNDDDALKRILNCPLLGLNSSSVVKNNQLIPLYNFLKTKYPANNFDKVIVISNSDSLTTTQEAEAWANSYIAQFGTTKPIFTSINLLNGATVVPPSITYNGNLYYGSGLLMNFISQKTGGIHFESHNNDVISICGGISSITIEPISPITVTAKADGNEQLVTELKEIKLEPVIPKNPKLYIGATTGFSNISFNLSTKIIRNDSTVTKNLDFSLSHDTTQLDAIISSMIGNEKIKSLLSVIPADTALVVSLGIRHNLLCDFTAMLALEPNDSIHFMKNPFDESPLLVENNEKNDSVFCNVYPNPFNLSTKITVNISRPSKINIEVYNILGKRVQIITNDNDVTGPKTYFWNGRNSYGSTVSSGVYFLRVIINDNATNKRQILTKKLLLLK